MGDGLRGQTAKKKQEKEAVTMAKEYISAKAFYAKMRKQGVKWKRVGNKVVLIPPKGAKIKFVQKKGKKRR